MDNKSIIGEKINDELDELYRIVKIFNNNDIKYFVKGNVLLHFIQQENNYYEYMRGTVDLDLHIERKELTDLTLPISNEYPNIIVKYSENGLVRRLSNLNLGTITRIDINNSEDINLDTKYINLYQIKDQKFYGNTVKGILRDKISSISSGSIRRRFKDIVDLYILVDMFGISEEELKTKLKKYSNGFNHLEDPETIKAKNEFKRLIPESKETIEQIYKWILEQIKDIKEGDLSWQ